MKLGTIVYDNKIYNLDYMTSIEISELLKLIWKNKNRENIILTAKLKNVYTNKISSEIIAQKMNNQLNSINASIININAKFNEKMKNYDKINEEIVETLNRFEDVLKQVANNFDAKIQKLIYKQLELELDNKTEEKKLIVNIIKKQRKLSEEKQSKIFSSMEVGGKEISINTTKKCIKISKVKDFFKFKFNTYKAIKKNVIEPLNYRIEEFRINELQKYGKVEEFEYIKVDSKTKRKHK